MIRGGGGYVSGFQRLLFSHIYMYVARVYPFSEALRKNASINASICEEGRMK